MPPPQHQEGDSPDQPNQQELSSATRGSGLASFFQDFLSGRSPSSSSNNNHYEYETSLQEVPPPAGAAPEAETEADGILNCTYKEYRFCDKEWLRQYVRRRYMGEKDEAVRVAEGYSSDENDVYEKEDTGAPWGQDLGEEEDNHKNDGGDDDEEEDSEDDEHKFETQQEWPAAAAISSPKTPAATATTATKAHGPAVSASSSRKKKPKVAPIYRTRKVVDNLEDLDFESKEISLDFCRIQTVWPLRRTKREPLGGKDIARPLILHRGKYRGTNLVRFPGMEEDGPLSSGYKTVISLELVPLKKQVPAQQPAISSRHPNPFRRSEDEDNQNSSSEQSPRRIRLFLYNEYAQAFSTWYEQFQKDKSFKGHETIMSLKRLGAINILPFPIDKDDLWQRSTYSQFCLCVGADSKTLHGDKALRFDTDDFVLQAVVVSKNGGWDSRIGREWTMSKALLVDDTPVRRTLDYHRRDALDSENDDGVTSEGSLFGKYQAWREQGRRPNDPVEPEQGAPRVSNVQNDPPIAAAEPSSKAPDVPEKKDPWDTDEEEDDTSMPQPDDGGDDGIEDEGFQTAEEDEQSTNQENRSSAQINKSTSRLLAPPDGNDREARGRLPQASDATPRAGRRRRPLNPLVIDSPAKRHRSAAGVPYKTINELRRINEESDENTDTPYNLRGVILNVTCPKQTKAGDWSMSFSLIDNSDNREDHELGQDPISLIVFHPDYEKLPKVRKIGDVLVCHRIRFNRWNGLLQLAGKRGSSFAVFFKNEDNVFEVVPTAEKNFTFSEVDQEDCESFWEWGQERVFSKATMLSNKATTLGELTSSDGDSFAANDKDMTVMITGMFPLPDIMRRNTSPCGFLRVWDGTGSSNTDPLPINSEAALRSIRDGDPPVEAIVQLSKVVQEIQKKDETFRIAPPQSLCGRVMNVFVWEETQWSYVKATCRVGGFLRIRNGSYSQQFWNQEKSISLSSNTWFALLPEATFEIREIIRNHQVRINRKDPDIPSGAVLPLPGDAVRQLLPEVPSRGLALFTTQEPSVVFSGKCRIAGTSPDCGAGIRQLISFNDAAEKHQYFFTIHLEDGHGSIHALVQQSEAQELIGISASEAASMAEDPKNRNRLCTYVANRTEFDVRVAAKVIMGRKHFLLKSISRV